MNQRMQKHPGVKNKMHNLPSPVSLAHGLHVGCCAKSGSQVEKVKGGDPKLGDTCNILAGTCPRPGRKGSTGVVCRVKPTEATRIHFPPKSGRRTPREFCTEHSETIPRGPRAPRDCRLIQRTRMEQTGRAQWGEAQGHPAGHTDLRGQGFKKRQNKTSKNGPARLKPENPASASPGADLRAPQGQSRTPGRCREGGPDPRTHPGRARPQTPASVSRLCLRPPEPLSRPSPQLRHPAASSPLFSPAPGARRDQPDPR